MLQLEESFLLQWWSLWMTSWRTPKATRSRKNKPTHSTYHYHVQQDSTRSTYHYHVPRDCLREVQSSTLQKTWDSFSRELKNMTFPFTNEKCMTPNHTSREWVTTKGYFSHVGTSFSTSAFILFHSYFVVELVSLSHIPPFSSFLQSLVYFFCEPMAHAHLVLIDGSLSCLQHNHISNQVWKGKERMICPRCNSVWAFTHLDHIDNC